MIYTIANTKGGVGKSTTAIHLAVMLSEYGDTLLIDADKQGSATAWANWRHTVPNLLTSPTVCNLYGKAIITEGRLLAKKFAHIVVDVGGADVTSLRSALIFADMAIVPIGASNLDADAMMDLLEVVEFSCEYNTKLQVRILLNRIDQRTKDTAVLTEFLSSNNLTILNSKISERVAFRRSIGEGVTVQELGKDEAAISEIIAFFKEVAQ